MFYVEPWQAILSQVFGIIQICITIWALQVKSKTNTLLLYTVANIFAVLNNAFLINWIIVATKSVSIFKNLAFAYVDKNRKTLKNWVKISILLFFMAAAGGAVALTSTLGEWHYFDFIILGALLFSYFTEWVESIHLLRVGLTIYTIAVLINAIMFMNITGMIMALITFAGVALFYVRLFMNKKNPPKEEPPAEKLDKLDSEKSS